MKIDTSYITKAVDTDGIRLLEHFTTNYKESRFLLECLLSHPDVESVKIFETHTKEAE